MKNPNHTSRSINEIRVATAFDVYKPDMNAYVVFRNNIISTC